MLKPTREAAEGEGGPEALLGQEAGDTNIPPSEEVPEGERSIFLLPPWT